MRVASRARCGPTSNADIEPGTRKAIRGAKESAQLSDQAQAEAETVGLTQCYTDGMSTDELLAEALLLTRVDRARVAEELLSSLEESDDEVATAWATELERRSREVAEGRVQTTSWETARSEILRELEQRRAPRTAP